MEILPHVLKEIIPFGSAALLKINQNTRASNGQQIPFAILYVENLCIQALCHLLQRDHFHRGTVGLREGLGARYKKRWGPGSWSEGLRGIEGLGF